LDETFEYLFLAIYSLDRKSGSAGMPRETIIPVFIKIFHDQAESDEWFYTFFRDDNAWMLF
jgi:hypothetical protein